MSSGLKKQDEAPQNNAKNPDVKTVTPAAASPQDGPAESPTLNGDEGLPGDEWSGLEPTEKDMGLVKFVLDRGVRTTVMGTVYGLDFEIEDEGYSLKVFFDYYNRRLKVIDYEANDFSAMMQRLAWLARSNDFDKIFVKARHNDFQLFLSHGYMMEGILRYYFNGEDAYVLSRFSSSDRVQSDDLLNEAKLVEELIYHSERSPAKPLDPEVEIIHARPRHIPQLVTIYRSVFESYPSPLTNPDYIKSTMEHNVLYRLALKNGEAVAAASADISFKYSNAEMTDCATIPEGQGKGLMQHILMRLEQDLKERDIMTAYTLARGMSVGMNRVFYRLGYEFSGRLINNCDIFGKFEDMNIWVKDLSAVPKEEI